MAIAALAAFVGAFVQSATGFGFALVLSPALFAVLDPVEAVTALLALGFLLNLLVFFEHGRPGAVDWPSILPMLIAAGPGLVVGFAVLEALSKEALQVAVGVAVLLAAGWQLRQRRRQKRPALPASAGWAVGFLSGTLTTSISVSGPPLVLWLEARGVGPQEFRASLAASAVHALEKRRGHCSDYHGFCAALGRALGYPTRVTYGINPFPKNSPSHCKLEAYLPPYGWVSFDVSETQKLIEAIQKDAGLGGKKKEELVRAARERLRRGFRDNTWLLQTRGTDYELEPPASKPVPVVRTR